MSKLLVGRIALFALVIVAAACSGKSRHSSEGEQADAGPDARLDGGNFSNSNGGKGGTAGAKAMAGSTAPAPSLPGLTALRLEPDAVTLTDDGVDPGEQAEVRAIGTFESGERDVTDEVKWELGDLALGTLEQGTFTSAGVGGASTIRALAAGSEATAELTISLRVAFSTEGAPEGIAELFPEDTAADTMADAQTLQVVYPS